MVADLFQQVSPTHQVLQAFRANLCGKPAQGLSHALEQAHNAIRSAVKL